jgi:hypothetical protein
MNGGKPYDHAWAIHPNGTIIDTTSSQFGKNSPMIVPPDHGHYSRYVSYERHPEQAQIAAHVHGDHEDDPGESCPHCKKSK